MTTRLREWTDEEKPELLPWRFCTGDPMEKRHWDKGSSSPDPTTQARCRSSEMEIKVGERSIRGEDEQ
jgi:hypothetical protein